MFEQKIHFSNIPNVARHALPNKKSQCQKINR